MKVSQTSRRRQAARTIVAKPGDPAGPPPDGVVAQQAPAAVDEEEALLQAFRMIARAKQALFDARSKLKAIHDDSTDAGEQADAAAGLLAIERDLALLENRRLALQEGTATLRPPSAADIAESQRIAGELAKPLAASARAAAIAGLAADIVGLTGKLSA